MTLFEIISVCVSGGALIISIISLFIVVNVKNKVVGNDNQVANLTKSDNNKVNQNRR